MKKSIALAVCMAAAAASHAQMSPVGLWQSIDDATGKPKAEIRIEAKADGQLSGVVLRALSATPNPEPLCVLCADDRKNQAKIGMEVIRGGSKVEGKDVWEGGKILDPENGKEYKLRMTPVDGGRKLEVRGYVGAPILGRTQTWLRQP